MKTTTLRNSVRNKNIKNSKSLDIQQLSAQNASVTNIQGVNLAYASVASSLINTHSLDADTNLLIPLVSSTPANPVNGMMVYDTSANRLRIYNNSWRSVAFFYP